MDWVAIELDSKEILGISISKEQNMFVAHERFLSNVVEEYGDYSVSTYGGTWSTPSMSIFKTCTLSSFLSWEKAHWKNNAVRKG